jgi:hypothetical protein
MPQKKKRASGKKRKRRMVAGCLAAIAVISLVVTGLIIGFRWQRDRADKDIEPSSTFALIKTNEISSSTVSPTLTLEDNESPTLELTEEPGLETISPGASRTPWPTNTLEP